MRTWLGYVLVHVTVSWHGHDEVRCFSVLDREEPKLRAIIISVECSDVLPFLSSSLFSQPEANINIVLEDKSLPSVCFSNTTHALA